MDGYFLVSVRILNPSHHVCQASMIVFIVHGIWLLSLRSAYTRPLVVIVDQAYSSWRQNIILEVYKGRAGCFRFATLVLGFELPQSCSAAVWHSNTSTSCPQAPDTIWFHSDVSRFVFFIVSWRSTYISIATSTSRSFNLSVSPHVIFTSGPLQVQVGHTGCLVAAFLTAFRACLQVMRQLCFCVMAHQRCDVGQHFKSYGSRRVAKRDSDGWLVVSVRLFSECGTSTCLLGNVRTFFPSRYGGNNFIVVSFGGVCHQSASVFTCLSVLFKWKVLVGERVVVRLSTWRFSVLQIVICTPT